MLSRLSHDDEQPTINDDIIQSTKVLSNKKSHFKDEEEEKSEWNASHR
jgi:hypothetical protein